MKKKFKKALFLLSFFLIAPAQANETAATCPSAERECILKLLETNAGKIDQERWRDQTYRELAKTLAFDKRVDDALALIDKIDNNDTKAMTIRGIGMAIADNKLPPEEYNEAFAKLRTAAEKIKHPPSYAIALTYIAMGQAFAGDNEGAWKTASDMENDALRHKAYGETAEIQAERGDYKAAAHSIEQIETESYRNKAYSLVSKILADQNLFDDALLGAQKITNEYKRAQALQYILDKQKPREVERGY